TFTALDNQQSTLTLWANDTAGNTNHTSVIFTVDTIFPAFSDYKRNPSLPNEDQNIEVNATISETPDTVILEWNSTTNYTVSAHNGNEYYFTIESGNYTAHDAVTYYWYANDSAGNINQSVQQSFIVANRAPEQPSLTYPLDNENISSANITFKYSSTDNDNEDTITYYIYINSILNTTTASNSTGINFSDGSYNWSVTAGDGYNNTTASDTRDFAVDTTAPIYSHNSTNSTIAGLSTEFSLQWADNFALSGYIFSFDNCTGLFVNDTFALFSGSWINVTKTINSTVGCAIRWQVYANDTVGNYNSSVVYSFDTTHGTYFPPQQPELNSPQSGTKSMALSVILNVSVTDHDSNSINVSFYNNATGAQINSTIENVSNSSSAAAIWSGLSYSTIYYWYANATDGTNETKSDIWNFTTKAYSGGGSSSSSSGSSSSGGSSRPKDLSREKDKVVLENKDPITKIEIYLDRLVDNPFLELKRYGSVSFEKPRGIIYYNYLYIEKKNFYDAVIFNATIEFRVKKSWISENRLSDASLLIYENDTWTILRADLFESKEYYNKYRIYANSFSSAYYVVAGVCKEGEKKCAGNNVEQCANGVWRISKNCTFGCDEKTSACKREYLPGEEKICCISGEIKCFDGQLKECKADEWHLIKTCDGGCNNTGTSCNIGQEISEDVKSNNKYFILLVMILLGAMMLHLKKSHGLITKQKKEEEYDEIKDTIKSSPSFVDSMNKEDEPLPEEAPVFVPQQEDETVCNSPVAVQIIDATTVAGIMKLMKTSIVHPGDAVSEGRIQAQAVAERRLKEIYKQNPKLYRQAIGKIEEEIPLQQESKAVIHSPAEVKNLDANTVAGIMKLMKTSIVHPGDAVSEGRIQAQAAATRRLKEIYKQNPKLYRQALGKFEKNNLKDDDSFSL
ncbi:MAG: hypothetical protein DRN66_02835, partial [Candidatus Nanohalarchaeota archaeon]